MMGYLKTYEEQTGDVLWEDIKIDVKNILLDISDKGIYVEFAENQRGMQIEISKGNRNPIKWMEIKDVIYHILNYMRTVGYIDRVVVYFGGIWRSEKNIHLIKDHHWNYTHFEINIMKL